jgi:hypothetical protein
VLVDDENWAIVAGNMSEEEDVNDCRLSLFHHLTGIQFLKLFSTF